MPVENISRLVGDRSTMVTETIYRKQLRPVIEGGAEVMDRGRQDQDVDCYPEGTIIFSQLGVLANLQAALMLVGLAQDNDRA